MIKLCFLIGKDVFYFKVDKRIIYYTDKNYQNNFIQCIPKDMNFINKIIASRNKLPRQLINMFTLSKKDQEEYDNTPTDEGLAENIIKDIHIKIPQSKLLSKEVIEDEQI